MNSAACLRLGTILLAALPLAAQIDTEPIWNGSEFISSFGNPNTATYGQTVTVPLGSPGTLTRFSFQIAGCTAAVTARAHIYAFNGSTATGSSLFSSAPFVIPSSNTTTFNRITVNTGNLTLPGGLYVFFFSISQDPGAGGACRYGSVTNTAYSGGQFVFLNNGTDTAQWTSSSWSTIASDLAMQSDLNIGAVTRVNVFSVPTLSEWAMIFLGCAFAFLAWRRLSSSQGTPSNPA